VTTPSFSTRPRRTLADAIPSLTSGRAPTSCFAWEAIDYNGWLDPNVLKRHEQDGRALQLRESGQETVDVRQIPGGAAMKPIFWIGVLLLTVVFAAAPPPPAFAEVDHRGCRLTRRNGRARVQSPGSPCSNGARNVSHDEHRICGDNRQRRTIRFDGSRGWRVPLAVCSEWIMWCRNTDKRFLAVRARR
jgi:hypothetical protein